MKIYKIAQFGDLLDDSDPLDEMLQDNYERAKTLEKTRLLREELSILKEKRTFSVGKRVQKTMGCRLEGTILDPFDWNKSNDGTYKPPTKDHVPIVWQDGSIGYENKCYLEVIVE